MDKIAVLILFSLIGVVLLVNLFSIFVNIFFGSKASVVEKEEELYEEENPLRDKLRSEIDENIRPHLNSLEGMYIKSETEGSSFSSYVLERVKEKLSPFVEQDEALVEEEICKCCSDYEGAACKEDFCLEGTGISCQKS